MEDTEKLLPVQEKFWKTWLKPLTHTPNFLLTLLCQVPCSEPQIAIMPLACRWFPSPFFFQAHTMSTPVIANNHFQQQKRHFTYEHHQMVNTEIGLFMSFVTKDRKAL